MNMNKNKSTRQRFEEAVIRSIPSNHFVSKALGLVPSTVSSKRVGLNAPHAGHFQMNQKNIKRFFLILERLCMEYQQTANFSILDTLEKVQSRSIMSKKNAGIKEFYSPATETTPKGRPFAKSLGLTMATPLVDTEFSDASFKTVFNDENTKASMLKSNFQKTWTTEEDKFIISLDKLPTSERRKAYHMAPAKINRTAGAARNRYCILFSGKRSSVAASKKAIKDLNLSSQTTLPFDNALKVVKKLSVSTLKGENTAIQNMPSPFQTSFKINLNGRDVEVSPNDIIEVNGTKIFLKREL